MRLCFALPHKRVNLLVNMNGWSNRETWLVVNWFSDLNAEGLSWDCIKGEIEDSWQVLVEKVAWHGKFFSDYINLGLINWDEIKRSAYGDEEE